MGIDILREMVETLKRYQPKSVVGLHQGVDRSCLLDLIEPIADEVQPQYVDDHSYVFLPV